MRRLIARVLALVCLSVISARAGGIGLGAFGGMAYPVLQPDAGSGMLYGVRAPVSVVPLLTVEPYWASSSLGDKVTTYAGQSYTRPGFEETVYGANLLLATGGPLSFYPLAGAGKARLKSGGASQSYTTYNAGFGLGVSAIPKLSFHVRGELQAVMYEAATHTFGGITVVDKKTTRKFGSVTAGVSYALFSLP